MKSAKKTTALQEKEGVSASEITNKISIEKIKTERKKQLTASKLVKKILSGDTTALSRAITLIESTHQKHQKKANQIIEKCLPFASKSIRIGITGVPGVGKSTFIEVFGQHLIKKGRKVAVLAVDPSSSVSKGSILGDKTRMEALVKEKNAFIRPSPTGNSLGGVARKTRETIILCEACGFDTILIETVGVGQSETAVHSMVDFFLLLKLAGAGDELQGIKRGIIEMADAIIINKADGDNIKAAKQAKTAFSHALSLYPPKENGWKPQVTTCSALENKGIADIWNLINIYMDEVQKTNYFDYKRVQQNKNWLVQTIEEQLKTNFYSNVTIKKELKKQLKAIETHKTTPFTAAQKLLSLYNK